ncbi:uncharacterized protein TrAtP1_008989 [Trichoderma atroviride]|uniref:uncharacterized protein n=1 Tax=Hypocrea atroviridis TaxID=63577 RepID=UPI0033339C11|nr:hypothetical protein TrAtP1_008989 [Trichoderma atroviride]
MSTLPSTSKRQSQACQECRRRKLRCDGKQPQCSTCENAGIECNIDRNRAPRGPKKGYITALQNKIETLESRLREQEQHHPDWSESLEYGDETLHPVTSHLPVILDCLDDSGLHRDLLTIQSTPLASELDTSISTYSGINVASTSMTLPSDHTPAISISECGRSCNLHITDLMQDELDQLYFDRIHAAVPILHQRRYLSWSRLSEKTRSRSCLQHAVWAAASLVSAHFQHLQHTLYPEVKRLLATTAPAKIPGGQDLAVDVELVQAWVLITTFEFIRMYHYEACLSAAHTFRLAQLMGLHKVDVLDNLPSINERDFITVEERRRVFWMAFTLEILLSMHSNLPLVVNEHMITTLLPVPDHDFQNGQLTETGFLHDLLSKRSETVKWPFNECIMLAAVCARASSYSPKSFNHLQSGHQDGDHVDRQKWLCNTLILRLQTLEEDYPSQKNSSDLSLLFANLLAQASIIYLCGEAQSSDWQTGSPDSENPLQNGSHQLAIGAAQHSPFYTDSSMSRCQISIHEKVESYGCRSSTGFAGRTTSFNKCQQRTAKLHKHSR